MTHKRSPTKKWKLFLQSVYRSDRDERIKRAYELTLPLLTTESSIAKQEIHDEQQSTNRHLCSRLKRQAS